MKRRFAIVFALMLTTQLVSPVTAQESVLQDVESSATEMLLPPRIDYVGVRATLLHWGMSRMWTASWGRPARSIRFQVQAGTCTS